MFELYKKNIDVVDATGKKQTYELLPLGGDMLPKVYKLIEITEPLAELYRKEDSDKDKEVSNKEFFQALGEDTIALLHEVITATFVKSYPNSPKEDIEGFVTQNLFGLFDPIIELNTQRN